MGRPVRSRGGRLASCIKSIQNQERCPLSLRRAPLVVAAAMRRIGGIALRQSLSHSRGPEAEHSRVSCIPDECPRPRPGMITTRLRKGLREAQQTQKRVAAENPTAHVDAHRELGKRVVRRYRSPRREALQGRGLARTGVPLRLPPQGRRPVRDRGAAGWQARSRVGEGTPRRPTRPARWPRARAACHNCSG